MLSVNSSYKICGIYSLYNKETDFSYIGSSRIMYERLSQHIWKLRGNKHTNEWLQNSFNKHGEEAFEIIILEICTEENLKAREEFHILNTPKRYNIMDKPTGPLHLPTPTEERRRKVSMANKGRKITEEQRQRFSDSHKGLEHTEEQKQNISIALKEFYSIPENRKLQSEKTLNSRDKSRETFLINHPDGHRVEWEILICTYCKKEFKFQPHLARRKKYCSNKCKHQDQKGKPTWNKGMCIYPLEKEMICLNCGVSFVSKLINYKYSPYCNLSCKSKFIWAQKKVSNNAN